MAVTIDTNTLRAEYLGEQDYRVFSQGSEIIAGKWITRAQEFVESIFVDNNKPTEYDELDDDISESVMLRACAEASLKGREFDDFRRYRNDAQNILIRILGAGADIYKTGENKEQKKKTIVTRVAGTTDYNGYGKWSKYN